jgi:AP-4 complex subunit beta-1
MVGKMLGIQVCTHPDDNSLLLLLLCRDLVIKKMIYLYLTNYAHSHPELAQMCTNTLQKDCGNEDPMVRGLALRALCGLNLPQMVEYIAEPLRRSLSDGHAYVRKTGVMGTLKLYDLDPEAFETGGFVDILYDMLRDPDANVVCNCIIVLNEVMQNSPNGGMAINRAIMLHLLNRIHEFNEFAKVQVLELVPRYIPANDEEGFQIMNLLDPVLRTSGSGAVMATMGAFLSLAEQLGDDTDEMKRQIVARVKAPIVTQISSGASEMMYTLLKHVEALVDMCPGIFDDEYRQFYVRFNEPTHVKYLKLNILSSSPTMIQPLTLSRSLPSVFRNRMSK